jgi:hypothetical protein
MSASLEDIEDSLFEDSSFDEKVTRFASDSGCQVVYITKETFIDVDEDGKLNTVSISSQKATLSLESHTDFIFPLHPLIRLPPYPPSP